eukprot:1594840-Prymnesium_polylepis.1
MLLGQVGAPLLALLHRVASPAMRAALRAAGRLRRLRRPEGALLVRRVEADQLVQPRLHVAKGLDLGVNDALRRQLAPEGVDDDR